MDPGLYHMDLQAGAPPDNFAVKGQNWGFPTYNWEEMEKDGFAWWKQRFGQMRTNYFDAFRIDHILGFFRIWSIPMDAVEGIMGHFSPAIPVYRGEFSDRQIWFDYQRYTRPFINDAVLWEVFGSDSDDIKNSITWTRWRMASECIEGTVQYAAKSGRSFCNPGKDRVLSYNSVRVIRPDLKNVILIEVSGSGEQRFHFPRDCHGIHVFISLPGMEHKKTTPGAMYLDYFYQRQDEFWRKEAMHKLPALKRATNMLVCGEDLGMVPRCVPDVMRQLGILSLEIQRMPKNAARQFSHPAEAPYLSVVMPSTHDMSTIRGWWEEDRGLIQQFFNQELGQWGEAPLFCEPWISKAIILQHLHSPALWSIFQLQDLLGMSEQFRRENPHSERINVPADAHHYWRYRMHITLEELIKEQEFNEELKGYVESSGR